MNKFKNIKALLIFFITTVVLFEAIYYGYFFYNKQKEVSFLNNKIEKLKIDIKTLKNMKRKIYIGKSFIKKTRDKYEGREFIFGATITSISFLEKISRPGNKYSYFRIRMGYKLHPRSIESLKLLLMLLYIDPDIVKITDIDTMSNSIDLYIKGVDNGK